MTLRLYNTETRIKQEFKPQEEGVVKMYTCGPTVYELCHIGHARSYAAFDAVKRYLAFRGYDVNHVQNFTDIEEAVYRRAAEEGVDHMVIADRYIGEYFADMDALGVLRARHYPRVTEHIPDMIEMVERIVEMGCGYLLGNDVYFNVECLEKFGVMSGVSEANVVQDGTGGLPGRKSTFDFVLWKGAVKDFETVWDSPWGKGRPGWHIECSAMALKYLGPTLDIHGGGIDLVYPHHESERAQAEAYSGETFANCYMHNGIVLMGREKMSKSSGNVLTIRELLETYPARLLRLYLLSHHYRENFSFEDEELAALGPRLEAVDKAWRRVNDLADGEHGEGDPMPLEWARALMEEFCEAMDDDIDTPRALRALYELSERLLDTGEGLCCREEVLELRDMFCNMAGDVMGLLDIGPIEA